MDTQEIVMGNALLNMTDRLSQPVHLATCMYGDIIGSSFYPINLVEFQEYGAASRLDNETPGESI